MMDLFWTGPESVPGWNSATLTASDARGRNVEFAWHGEDGSVTVLAARNDGTPALDCQDLGLPDSLVAGLDCADLADLSRPLAAKVAGEFLAALTALDAVAGSPTPRIDSPMLDWDVPAASDDARRAGLEGWTLRDLRTALEARGRY